MTPRELFFLLLGMFMVGTVVFWVVFYFAIKALTSAVNTLVTIITPLSNAEFLGRMDDALETLHTQMPMMLKAMVTVNKTLGVFNSALFQKEFAGAAQEETRSDVLEFTYGGGKERRAPVAAPPVPEPENAPEGSGGVIVVSEEELVRNEIVDQAKRAGIKVPDEKDMPEPPSA